MASLAAAQCVSDMSLIEVMPIVRTARKAMIVLYFITGAIVIQRIKLGYCVLILNLSGNIT